MILPYDTATLSKSTHALPGFSYSMVSQIFKLIFPKSSSWPKTMYAKHRRKLAWVTFSENFPMFLVQ